MDGQLHQHAYNDVICYPCHNLDNGATVEVEEWISNFIPQFIGYMITYMLGSKLIRVSKAGPC